MPLLEKTKGKTNLNKVVLLVLTFSQAARLPGEPEPGVVNDLLQEVTVDLQLRQTPTCWVVGLGLASNPVQVTASTPGYELQQTPGEAVALPPLLLLPAGRVFALEGSPPDELELAGDESFSLDVETRSLAQSQHVNPRPELASLMQVNPVTIGVVPTVAALNIPSQSDNININAPPPGLQT